MRSWISNKKKKKRKNTLIFLDILAVTQLPCFPSPWQDTFPASCQYSRYRWAAGGSPTPLEAGLTPQTPSSYCYGDGEIQRGTKSHVPRGGRHLTVPRGLQGCCGSPVDPQLQVSASQAAKTIQNGAVRPEPGGQSSLV